MMLSKRTLFCLVTIHQIANNDAFLHTPSLAVKNNIKSTPFLPSTATTTTTLQIGDFFNFGKKDEPPSPPSPEEEPPKKEPRADTDDSDPVEKIFSFFFGQKEDNPMGMARFGPERFPEQYPATTTEWAAPVESDSPEVAKYIRPFLKNTNLETRGLTLTYDAGRDGWNAAAFHACVDRKGGGVVLCETTKGQVCGGYNPKGWVGYGEARGSIAAFLFTVGEGGDAIPPGVKLRKVGGPGLAQMDAPENGPSFGADSLVIPLGNNNPKMARSKLGSYYERFEDGTNSLFGKEASVQLKSLKVYHGVYAEGEYIPFTDAEPFALY